MQTTKIKPKEIFKQLLRNIASLRKCLTVLLVIGAKRPTVKFRAQFILCVNLTCVYLTFGRYQEDD